MTVYLIKTPYFADKDFTEVQDVLEVGSKRRMLVFKHDNHTFTIQDFPFLQNTILRESEISSLCKEYRRIKKVNPDDFVILLTSIRHEGNYFSFFDNQNNAFVHTEDWGRFIEGDRKYPIAYEIVANILQSLMHLSVESETHHIAKGCINDMCINKKDILVKLRTGEICEDCLELMEEKGVPERTLSQALDIFRHIKTELLWLQGFRNRKPTKTVTIDKYGDVFIEGEAFKPDPLQKTLYILFLKNLKGLKSKDLEEKKEDFSKIYYCVQNYESKRNIDQTIDKLIKSNFKKVKSELNDALIDHIGDLQGHNYCITQEKRGGIFKVGISQDLITDNFTFRFNPKNTHNQ